MNAILSVPRQIENIETFKVEDISMACPNEAQMEKNWAMFVGRRSERMYQYSLTPWKVLNSRCDVVLEENTVFSKLSHCLTKNNKDACQGFFGRSLVLSCSTPLIPYDKDTLIGVGHYKGKLNEMNRRVMSKNNKLTGYLKNLKQAMSNNKVKTFRNLQKNRRVHFNFLYGMFFYTMDRHTYKLKTFSPMLSIMDPKVASNADFPHWYRAARQKHIFLVSYHENDINVKMLQVNRAYINSLLIYNNNTAPESIDFRVISQNSVIKNFKIFKMNVSRLRRIKYSFNLKPMSTCFLMIHLRTRVLA